MAVQIQIRRGLAAAWTAANPILAQGELGIELDTRKFKVGDGLTSWTGLLYVNARPEDVTNAVDAAVASILGDAPSVLDSLGELSDAINDDPNFFSSVVTLTSDFNAHAADTTNVHGIADTSLLETQAGATAKANAAEAAAVATAAADATTKADAAQAAAIASANSYTDSQVSDLIQAAPGALDTLNELAAAINDDENFAATVANNLSSAVASLESYADQAESDAVATAAADATAKSAAAEAAAIAASNSYTDAEVSSAVTSLQAYADASESSASATAAADATAKANAAEAAAKSYTDAEIATATASLEAYADQAESDATSAAQTYTDSTLANAVTSLEAYTDTAEGDAVTAANAYTDAEVTAATTALEAYADQAEADALSAAQTYAYQQREAAEAYADQAEVDAVATANAYTDAEIVTATAALQSYADQAEADANAYTDSAVAGLVDSAPAVLDTLNELSAALNNDADFATTVANQIASVETTAAADLASAVSSLEAYADQAESDAVSTAGAYTDAEVASSAAALSNSLSSAVASLTSQVDDAATGAGTALATHNSNTTNVHGIADTSALETQTGAQDKADAAEAAANTYTDGEISSVTASLQSYADQAEADAISAAASDATTKANAAEAAANSYTDTAVSDVVFGAPADLDTLDALAAAINDDAAYHVTVQNALDGKQPLDGDLTAIAAIAETAGLLKKTAADTWSLDTSVYLTGNETVTLSGDVTGSGTTGITATLANSGVAAGTYGDADSVAQVTVDAKGRVTSASSVDIAVTQSQVTGLVSDLAAKAPLESPGLTGTPTAPTAAAGTNTTQVATTAFVSGAISDLIGGAPAALDTLNELAAALADDADYATTITSALAGKQPLDADLTAIAALAGTSGILTKTAADTWALDTNVYLTGNETISVTGDVTGSGATSISLTLANSGVTAGTYNDNAAQVRPFTVDAKGRVTAVGTAVDIAIAQSAVTDLVSDLAAKAPLASPALSGVPTAPTAATSTDTTQIATTAFVQQEIAANAADKVGTNATGTWDIDISGNAATVSAIDMSTATAGTLAVARGGTGTTTSTGSGSTVLSASPSLTGTVTAQNVTITSGYVLNAPMKIEQKTASYTFVAGDEGKFIEMNSGSALTFTVPADGTVNFAVGTQIHLLRVGAGGVNVAAASGVTINATPGLNLRAQWSGATLTKRAANVWVLTGDLS